MDEVLWYVHVFDFEEKSDIIEKGSKHPLDSYFRTLEDQQQLNSCLYRRSQQERPPTDVPANRKWPFMPICKQFTSAPASPGEPNIAMRELDLQEKQLQEHLDLSTEIAHMH